MVMPARLAYQIDRVNPAEGRVLQQCHEDLHLIQHALSSFQHNTCYHALIQKIEDLVENSNVEYGPNFPQNFWETGLPVFF
ncbi:hypothetical protein [Paracoccus sediminilitoris]|uniref:hypothetical protein n=1 Tax=Paracoccus sediminilitoris TaxID=2202419 RepID=UPI00272B75A7|nr:hypothetical protein [Paracoccus sediminilitoris]